MSIVDCPDGTLMTNTVECVICKRWQTYGEVSAGVFSPNDQQAFACNSHFRDGGQLYVGWVNYIIEEQLQDSIETYLPWDEDWDAWQAVG